MARVVVCGSINADLVVKVSSLPRPGETVSGSGFARYPGGKGANQAIAAAKAGAHVSMLGAVGADMYGAELVTFLAGSGVDTSQVLEREGVPTGTSLIVVEENGENVIVFVAGANATVDNASATALALRENDVLLAQLETPMDATLAFFRHGKRAGANRILNPSPAAELSRELCELTDVLVVNETELAFFTGHALSPETSESELREARAALAGVGFHGSLIVTLGASGVAGLAGDQFFGITGHAVRAVDTTGAGDCLAAQLCEGVELDAALRYANAASALAVQKHGAGASTPIREQVEAFLNG